MTLPVLLHAFGTLPLLLSWECRLRVFKNRVLRIFEPKDNGSGEYYITRALVICTTHQIFCRQIKKK
jgi:hypothetical protein